MAARAKLIAELASSHGGDLACAREMIRIAAECGADFCKIQLYDSANLRDDDPQKAWLTQAQVTRPMLDALIQTARDCHVELTASVFGIPEAQMAKDAGLTTIKIGSGDSRRRDLFEHCLRRFDELWLSEGIDRAIIQSEHHLAFANPKRVRFASVSQYPAPAYRSLARLLQCDKSGVWGWSCHAQDTSIAQQAILQGAAYVERHFTIPTAPRQQPWDSLPAPFMQLRKFAEAAAWEETDEWREAQAKYLHRWTR